SAASAARRLRLALQISIVLASQIVQVTTEASARPTMTPCTTGSAVRAIPNGERSRGVDCAQPAPAFASHAPSPTPSAVSRAHVPLEPVFFILAPVPHERHAAAASARLDDPRLL